MEHILCIILVRAIFIKKCHLCVPLPTSLPSLQLSATYWHQLCCTVTQLLGSWAVLIHHCAMQRVYIKWPSYVIGSQESSLSLIEIIYAVTVVVPILILILLLLLITFSPSSSFVRTWPLILPIPNSNYFTAMWFLLFHFISVVS